MIALPSLRSLRFILPALGLLAVILLWRMAGARADRWQASHERIVAARAADHAIWRQAVADATLEATRRARATETRRAKLNERIAHDALASRARSDAAYRRLLDRIETTRAAAGADGGTDLPADADAACRTYAATPCHQLPALLKAAQDNTDQLIALQAWARGLADDATP